jgi:hypothetical protein
VLPAIVTLILALGCRNPHTHRRTLGGWMGTAMAIVSLTGAGASLVDRLFFK